MEDKANRGLVVAATVGFLGVALGAFGAHVVKSIVSPQGLDWWHTAVEYHLFHALALLALGLAPWRSKAKTVAQVTFALGIVLFSGSLYALALTGIGWWGVITPLGGVAFLVGWVAIVVAGWKDRPR